MKRLGSIGLWWVPLLLLLLPLTGRTPAHRDLADFFFPMRTATAEMLLSGSPPWLNHANGCGEAWFANPETGVLYPPAWLHLFLPSSWAMTAEIALHLTWLSLGVGLLAGRLGAGRRGRILAEVAAWSAGPVLATVGVLNNLETIAWLPWMVVTARLENRVSIPLLAAVTAMAWLGGEPQIWALGLILVVATARRRWYAIAGLVLGIAVVTVQLVPFIFWVFEGDRGPGAAGWVLRGALSPADWVGLVTPGLEGAPGRMIYAESLFFGAPFLLCALLGGLRHKGVLLTSFALGLLSTLPEIGAGGVFLGITQGMVRYPSRFAVVGLAMLLPLIGPGADAWIEGNGRRIARAVALFSLFACVVGVHPWRWWVAGVPALFLLVSSLASAGRSMRIATLLVGLMGAVAAGLPLLDPQPIGQLQAASPTWPESREGGRIYSPAPAADVVAWLSTGLMPRRMWPVGYLNLQEGTALAPTYAPVSHMRLSTHLKITDEGPHRRWWLDVLSARWVVLPVGEGLPEGMIEVRRRAGLRMLRNRFALPLASVAAGPPVQDQPWIGSGAVTFIEAGSNRLEIATVAPQGGSIWIAQTPVRGWGWQLDGSSVNLSQGPGILQHLQIEPGFHVLAGRYRPPALIPAATISVVAAAILLLLMAIASRERPWRYSIETGTR